MIATCPHCQFQAEIEAFFTDDDGKRLAAVMADVPSSCGRAVLKYLRLFKPAKTALRVSKAVRLATEVRDLISTGTVCDDERSGVRRPCTPEMWVEGIELMLDRRDELTLPMKKHGYLRTVVYGIADKADAQAERAKETAIKAGKRPDAACDHSQASARMELNGRLSHLARQLQYGGISKSEHDQAKQAAIAQFEAGRE